MSTKTLLLLRHAKSSWDDPELDDHDRPLNGRGRKAATRMGRLIQEQQYPVDLLLCSTAVRAQETAQRVTKQLKHVLATTNRDDLYHASPEQIVEILTSIDDKFRCPLLIGHNPGFEEFLTQLTKTKIQLPTAALAQIELPISHWNDLTLQSIGTLKQIWRPRDLETD